MQSKLKHIMGLVLSMALAGLGIYALLFWYAGSHGHIRFRPHKPEDWLLSSIVALCFGLPLYFLAKAAKRGR